MKLSELKEIALLNKCDFNIKHDGCLFKNMAISPNMLLKMISLLEEARNFCLGPHQHMIYDEHVPQNEHCSYCKWLQEFEKEFGE